MIAQEFEEVFPEWVDETPDGHKFVTERGTTALLVEALRDLRAKRVGQLVQRDGEISALRVEKNEQIQEVRNRLSKLEQSLLNITLAGNGDEP